MSKKAISSFVFKAMKALLVVMMVTTMYPLLVKAETSKKVQYFVVEKKWENDIKDLRPDKVTIHVEDEGGTEVASADLTAPDWKASFTLPAYNSDSKQIVYSVYEDADGLDKYLTSNPRNNKLTISKSIIMEDNSERKEVSTYELNTSGFGNVPEGNIVINKSLSATDESIVSMPEGFSLGNYSSYTKPTEKEESPDTRPRIKYNGDLAVGENSIPGSIVMEWDGYAVDYLTGKKYDIRLTISDIKIFSPVAHKNANVAILANYGSGLHMQSYVTEFSENAMENIVGVKAKIDFKITDNGSPIDGFTQLYLTDLDTADSAQNFYDHKADYEVDPNYQFNKHYNEYFGVDRNYAESITFNNGVASDIYVAPDTCLEYTDDLKKFAAKKDTPNWDNDPRVSVELLVCSGNFSYTWSGSDCGTAINTGSPSVNPTPDQFTNTITNISSRYRIEYYYQKESESGVYYSTTPDYPENPVAAEIMVKPGTDVEVSKEDKTPSESRGMPTVEIDPLNEHPYVLDEAMNSAWKGTTSTTDNPLILKVYFKKTYRVTYHDNVKDEVWNAKEKQNNPELVYGENTPVFDTTKSEADSKGNPVRKGYDFKGWSETPEGEIITIPGTVTKDADYWAHWEARTDTKYKVEYYYEVDGSYPVTPDFTSADREGTTDETVSIISSDKVPMKSNYELNPGMTLDWTGVVKGDGSLVLKVYFKLKPVVPEKVTTYNIPVTGVE